MPDPKDYQVIRNGKVVQLVDLNEEELREELIKALDFLEDLDEIRTKFSMLVDEYRSK